MFLFFHKRPADVERKNHTGTGILCSKCHFGSMLFTGEIDDTRLFVHRCETCGNVRSYDNAYPHYYFDDEEKEQKNAVS